LGCAARAAAALVAAFACAAAPARALELRGRDAAEVEWAPATGDVSAYVVFVSRDGGPYRSEQYTQRPRARIAARPGETIQVRVRAYGLSGERTLASPPSEPSEPIRFVPPDVPAEVAAAPPPAALAPGAGTALLPGARTALAPGPSTSLAPGDSVRRIPGFRFAPPLRVEAHGDFDGDGDLDLLATLGSWRHPLVLFLEDASLEHAVVLGSLGEASGALAADFDGDRRDDVALFGAGQLRVVRLERGGKFGVIAREPLATGARLVPADLDGDGAASLVVYEPATGRLHERLGKRNADFGSIQPLHALRAGDFDGDGRDDLWIQPAPGPHAELWLMRAEGGFEVARVTLGRNVGVATVADVNGDGRDDLAGYDPGRAELRAFLLDGGRVIGERLLASGPVESVASGDFDGDGLDDLLLRAPGGEASALVLSR